MTYTQPVIEGVKYREMLPPGYALVLEGGGTRGYFSSGVFEAFMEAGIMFPYVIGVSAGAANALSYISGQRGRGRQIVEHYVGDPRYVSRRNLLRYGSLFGYDFIFDTIPNEHIFWDRALFESVDIRFLTGTMDCATGKTLWFEKKDIGEGLTVTRASCSIPLISKIVRYGGHELLDGGVSDPIPIEKSLADGNDFHVIVLTQNAAYVKKPIPYGRLIKMVYRKYPGMVETILTRHEIYMRQLALCEQLAREGRAVIIRPQVPLDSDRTVTDVTRLLALYDEGYGEGRPVAARLMEILR